MFVCVFSDEYLCQHFSGDSEVKSACLTHTPTPRSPSSTGPYTPHAQTHTHTHPWGGFVSAKWAFTSFTPQLLNCNVYPQICLELFREQLLVLNINIKVKS